MTLPHTPTKLKNPAQTPAEEVSLSGPPTDRTEIQSSIKDMVADSGSPQTVVDGVGDELNRIEKGMRSSNVTEVKEAVGAIGKTKELLDAHISSPHTDDAVREKLKQIYNRLSQLEADLIGTDSSNSHFQSGGRAGASSLESSDGGGGHSGYSGARTSNPWEEKKRVDDPSLSEHIADITKDGGLSLEAGSRRRNEIEHAQAARSREEVHEGIVKLIEELKALDMSDGRDGGASLSAIINSICEAYPPSASALKAQVDEINRRQAMLQQQA
jgi:hypothetical protein